MKHTDESGNFVQGNSKVAQRLRGEKGFNNLAALSSHWQSQGVVNDIGQHPTTGNLQLSRVVVPKDMRSGGIGTKFMQDLTSFADKQKRTVTLTPDSSFGGSVGRLRGFYKRFGFVENKGRKKDFTISDAMYRPPQI